MANFEVKMVDGTYTSNFVRSQNLTKTTRKAVFWFWFCLFRSWNFQGKDKEGWNSKNILEAER